MTMEANSKPLNITKKVTPSNRKKLMEQYRKVISNEAEHTHIKKGVKGFVTVPEEQQKNKIQGFALTETEANYITLAAKHIGISKSTLIRRALRAYLMPEEVMQVHAVNDMQGQLFED